MKQKYFIYFQRRLAFLVFILFLYCFIYFFADNGGMDAARRR